MKVLIKIGGTLLDSPESRGRLAAEISQVLHGGTEAVVVHGGGKQMTRFLAERGVESRFVNGLRVTTPEVLDAVLNVFAGSVNKKLVAAFIAAGTMAVGITGMDALITEAVTMNEELGSVGRPTTSNIRLLTLLIQHEYLPVVACVAGDRQGRFYNVNADQMAVSVASALGVDKLLFLTDVEGVCGRNNIIYPTITTSECDQLIVDQIATGGMQAKLEAASDAIRYNVGEVVIAPGAVPRIVARLLAGEQIGTRVTAGTGA